MKIEGDCPHCKKNVAIDIDKLEVKTAPPAYLENSTAAGTQMLESRTQIVEKPVIKEVLPEYMPAGRCKNGNCDVGIHKNPNYKKKVRGKCTNCGQFSGHKDGDCPWCKKDGKHGEIDEIDDDELEDLGIPNPPENEHEGHDHD